MNRSSLTGATLVVLASLIAGASAQSTPEPGLLRAGQGPTMQGSAEYFTGRATVRPMVTPEAPGRTSVGAVTFAPGARGNWHTHPAGQALVVTEGCGWAQREGRPVIRICQGDTVYVPAGVRHWHGATATESMTHLAITESIDDKNVEWMEPVTDAQYREGARSGG